METSSKKQLFFNKMAGWWENPYNRGIVWVLFVAFAIRIYYFILTYGQPVWWDEADYLNIAKHWVNGLDYPVNVIRPIFLPLIASAFYIAGLGEFSVRLFILASSLACIFLTYLIGKQFFNEKVGLISSTLLAGFWSFTYFTYRILVDVPLTLLWLLSIYLFFDAYFKEKSWKYFILPGIFLGFAFLMKFTSTALVLIFAIYLLGTEKFSLFKNKRLWVFAASSLITVLPFFIWEKLKYGSFIAFYSKTTGTIATKEGFFSSFFGHLVLSAKFLTLALEIIFFLSLAWMVFEFFLSIDAFNKKNTFPNKSFFTLLWILISVGIFAFLFSANSAEERYYFIFYPALFLVISKLLVDISAVLSKYGKILGTVFIIFILILSLYPNVKKADEIIKLRKDSFAELKQAGLWINANTQENESFLVVEESAETVYYAERKYNIEEHNIKNKTDLLNRIEKHHPSYLVLSFYYYFGRNEGGSLEVVQYVLSNPQLFPIEKTFGPNIIGDQGNLPLVIVVKVNPILWSTS